MSREPNDPNDPVARAMREAEQAVERVRLGRDDDGEGDDGIDVESEPGDPPDPPDTAVELAAARAQTEVFRDKWMRAMADHENYKKRTRRESDEALHRAIAAMLTDFLPIGDNLERALTTIPAGAEPALVKGLLMVRGEFLSALARHGIKPIDSVGSVFDPNLHDALQQVDSPDYPAGVVVMEYERGYLRGERLLRAARVVVAGPGSTGTGTSGTNPDAAGSSN